MCPSIPVICSIAYDVRAVQAPHQQASPGGRLTLKKRSGKQPLGITMSHPRCAASRQSLPLLAVHVVSCTASGSRPVGAVDGAATGLVRSCTAEAVRPPAFHALPIGLHTMFEALGMASCLLQWPYKGGSHQVCVHAILSTTV